MLLLLFLTVLQSRNYIAGNNKDTKIISHLKNGVKSPISHAFKRQVSEKKSEYLFYPDPMVRHWGGWEPPMQIHYCNARSSSAADVTPARSSLAVHFFLCWWGMRR